MCESVVKEKDDSSFGTWMREFYNNKAGNLFKDNYEYVRWFSTPVKRRQYKFSTISLLFHLRNIKFKKCLEIGCGPGTWTRLLLKKYSNASFTCLDISKEMIKQFRRGIKSKKVKTLVNNFLDQKFKEKFNFVFCSRAIEYIPNKPKVIEKFYDLLENGGKGIIVTSHPHPTIVKIKRLFGEKINKEHTQRISVNEMRELLQKAGFVNIKFYPILFSDFFLIPTSILFYTCYKYRWGILSRLFATGYVVSFDKP